MKIAVFGANGPTGRILVEDALGRNHAVRAATRHPDEFPLHHDRLEVVRADVADGSSLAGMVTGCQAVASVLGAGSYSRKPITVYSQGTRAIVSAMREVGCKRIVVVSSGLTYPPGRGHGFLFDMIVHPLLHNVIGRTLYADMRAMEEFLHTQPDLDWTVMRPGRLVDGDVERPYLKEPEAPRSRRFTTRQDLEGYPRRSRERRRRPQSRCGHESLNRWQAELSGDPRAAPRQRDLQAHVANVVVQARVADL